MPLAALLRKIALLAVFLLLVPAPSRGEGEAAPPNNPVGTVVLDLKNFYLSRSNLLLLGTGIAVDAVPANTNLDRWIRAKYQDDLRTGGTDDIARIAKVPGIPLAALSAYAGAFGIGRLGDIPALEAWALGAVRATIVAAPALLLLERGLGSERPEDGDSHWKPFHGSEGASGHAFFGAIPFLTAAEMSGDLYRKGLFYALSTLPALSRINDDAHYFSQASLGWYLAWLGVRVVSKGGGEETGRTTVGLAPVPGGIAVTVLRIY